MRTAQHLRYLFSVSGGHCFRDTWHIFRGMLRGSFTSAGKGSEVLWGVEGGESHGRAPPGEPELLKKADISLMYFTGLEQEGEQAREKQMRQTDLGESFIKIMPTKATLNSFSVLMRPSFSACKCRFVTHTTPTHLPAPSHPHTLQICPRHCGISLAEVTTAALKIAQRTWRGSGFTGQVWTTAHLSRGQTAALQDMAIRARAEASTHLKIGPGSHAVISLRGWLYLGVCNGFMWVFFHANNDQTVEMCICLPCGVAETTQERGMKVRGFHSILYETVLMNRPVQRVTL